MNALHKIIIICKFDFLVMTDYYLIFTKFGQTINILNKNTFIVCKTVIVKGGNKEFMSLYPSCPVKDTIGGLTC